MKNKSKHFRNMTHLFASALTNKSQLTKLNSKLQNISKHQSVPYTPSFHKSNFIRTKAMILAKSLRTS